MNLSAFRARAPGITACLILCIFLQGCATWRRQQGSVRDVLGARPERSLRVQSQSDTTVLHQPWVDGDSLRGVVRSERRDASTGTTQTVSTQVAIPLSDIQAVDVRRVSGKRTTLLTVGIGAGIFGAVVLAVALSGDWFDGSSCSFYTCAP